MSFQLFDRVRAFFKSTGLYGHENLLQNQSNLDRIASDGNLINYSSSGLLDQTNLQINRMERYKDFDQMDEMGEISLALDLYADEATQIDPEIKHSVQVRAKTDELKEELEKLFFDILNIDNKIRPMARYLCKYGDFAAEIIPNDDRTEVASFRPFNIYSFLRVETKFGDLVGFFFTDEMMAEPVFMHPWQVMHLRLISYENIYAPYGRSILDGGRKDFRRLRLMEDAALVYRITRAPEKRIFTIPVGNIPTNQIETYLNQISDQFKKQRFFDPASGDVNWRYAPLIQEDDFWLPQRPDGTGPKIDTLSGAENLDQIADIEYFKKKMIAPLKIPFSRVGIGADAGGNADKTLASSHTDFAKAVQFVQRELIMGLKKIALVHLALKGFSKEDMDSFDLTMTSSSAIDELYRIETWNSRANVISTLKDTGLFPDEWILSRFTDLTKDEIEEMQEELEKKAPVEEGEGGDDLGGDLGGPDLGLPGLESVQNLESKVINEFQRFKEGKRRIIKETYQKMFSNMLNNHELDGLPLETKVEKILTEGNEDPFDITGENSEETIIEHTDYLVDPVDDDEATAAKEATKQILQDIGTYESSSSMVVPMEKIVADIK
jgi:hypothetical protein